MTSLIANAENPQLIKSGSGFLGKSFGGLNPKPSQNSSKWLLARQDGRMRSEKAPHCVNDNNYF
jgi:hypothetical protein